jgi:hypothetical protein
MGGLLSKHGKRRVFILGAGFKAPLGMPLTADLLREVHAVAADKTWVRNGVRPDDYHSRALIYPRLVHGAREGRLKVKLVAMRPARASSRRRFDGCRFCFEGFSPQALEFIEQP